MSFAGHNNFITFLWRSNCDCLRPTSDRERSNKSILHL